MIKHCLGNSQRNSIPKVRVFFHNFSLIHVHVTTILGVFTWLNKALLLSLLLLFLLLQNKGTSLRVPLVRADIREFKKTTTATATGTSLNKRFNEQNNRCARAL